MLQFYSTSELGRMSLSMVLPPTYTSGEEEAMLWAVHCIDVTVSAALAPSGVSETVCIRSMRKGCFNLTFLKPPEPALRKLFS